MNRIFGIAVGMLVFVTLGASAVLAQPQLDGTWVPQRGVMHGEVVPMNALQSMTLIFSSGSFKASSGAMSSTGRVDQFGYEANQFDLQIQQGTDQGRLIKAIFKIEGPSLTITFSETDQFPTGYDSTVENRYLTLVYQKQGATGTAGLPPAVPQGGGTGSSFIE